MTLALVASACGKGDAFRPLRVGERPPAYAARTLGGDSARVGAGQPLTLVNIWATWCIPCRREFPELEQLHRDYGGRGLRVLAVSVDRGSDGPVQVFADRIGATFTIGRDEAGDIQQLYQTVGVPESFLVGSDGKLRWRKIGAFEAGAPDARAAIEAALPAGGRP